MTRQSQPNFTTVQPDGSITATFPGGLEVLLQDNPPFGAAQRVRWVRQSDGALVADILGSTASGGSLVLSGYHQNFPETDYARVELDGDNSTTRVQAVTTVPPADTSRVILNASGVSSFAQVPNVTSLLRFYLFTGFVNGTTGVLSAGRFTEGFGVTRTSTGRYTWALTNGESYAVQPLAITPFSTTVNPHVFAIGLSGQTFTYGFNNAATLAAVDLSHIVTAIGMEQP